MLNLCRPWVGPLLFAGASLLAGNAHAELTPDQFFCDQAPLSNLAPIMYDYGGIVCPGKDGAVVKNMCTLPTMCFYMSPEFLADVQEGLHKDFRGLSAKDKKSAFMNFGIHAPPFAALLSCAGKIKAGQRICPFPDDCQKLAFSIHPNAAAFPEQGAEELGEKVRAGTTVFRPVARPTSDANTTEPNREE